MARALFHSTSFGPKELSELHPALAGASFGPEALKVMGAAFDAAWADVENSFGRDPTVVEAARHLLAEAVLCVATEESRDVQALKTEVLQALALSRKP